MSSILILFSIQFYYLSSSYKRDVNSYVTLVKWACTLTRDAKKSILKVSDKNLLKTWDVVSTIWSDSLAVIQWWDKSITRLWWNSRIEIKENFGILTVFNGFKSFYGSEIQTSAHEKYRQKYGRNQEKRLQCVCDDDGF